MLGFFLGPLADLFHNLSETSYYPHPFFLGLAFFVPFLFGSATVLVGLSHVFIDQILSRHISLTWTQVVLGLVGFLGIYAVSGYFRLGPSFLLYLLLGSIAIVIWYFLDQTAVGLFLALLTAIGGCAVEITLGLVGQFHYNAPDLWGIPLWLPFLYMVASVAVGNLARKMYEIEGP